MKKIGILTFHYVDNYGAVLQAWALLQVLNALPDCYAEIINYVPKDYYIIPYRSGADSYENMISKRKKYELFLTKHCRITSPMVSSVTGENYDYICVGSDQVWNLHFRENETMEYLLPNVHENICCFSYAASMGIWQGKADVQLFQKYAKRFSAVSVRENDTCIWLRERCGIHAVTTIDPSLLLSARDYKALMETQIIEENFLLYFSYPIGDEIWKSAAFAKRLARRYGLRIMHTVVNCPDSLFGKEAKCIMYDGMEAFLWYMKHARIVVTTSYHGVAFSVVYRRPLYIFLPNTGANRIEDLAMRLHLMDRIVREILPWDALSDQMEYADTVVCLEQEQKSADAFFKKALALEVN